MLYIEFKLKHTFMLIVLVLIVINFVLATNATFQKRDAVACTNCLDGCCGNAKTIDDYNTCANGCKNGPVCQGVVGTYECKIPVPPPPPPPSTPTTGNVEACKNCLDGCCGNAKTVDDFNTCADGCNNGPDCQGVVGTYECKIPVPPPPPPSPPPPPPSTPPTGNVEACKNCLDGCCGNAKTIDDFKTCADGCNGGPDCQSVVGTYECQAIQSSQSSTVPIVPTPPSSETSSQSLPGTATEAEIATTTAEGVLTPTPIPPNAKVITTKTTTTSYISGYTTTDSQGSASTVSPSKLVVVESVAVAGPDSPNAISSGTKTISQDFDIIRSLWEITISLAIVSSNFVFTLLF